MKHISIKQCEQELEQLLITDELRPYLDQDILHNGFQTRGSDQITKIGFGVSASMELFRLAKEEGCQAIIVHHGLNVEKRNLDVLSYQRFAYLIQNDISLWGGHFVLDAHPVLGNNAQILKTIGAKRTAGYPYHNSAPWGAVGEFSQASSLESILDALKGKLSPNTITYDFGPKEVKKVVAMSGKGAPRHTDMQWLIDNDVDLYMTGEAHEWNREFFREAGIHFIAGGHYHTEMFGLKAVQKHISQEWDIATAWLDLENSV